MLYANIQVATFKTTNTDTYLNFVYEVFDV